jgi:hypothetical protein
VTILVASAIWLIAYPAMWLRMMAVVVEMEAKKEYEAFRRELQKLHLHHRAHLAGQESEPNRQPPTQIRP